MPERYDLHAHLFTTWEQGRLSLERASRDPDYVLDAVRNAGLDGIALVNFVDERYERFREAIKENRNRKYRLVRDIENALILADEEGFVKVIKGDEVPAEEGHVLLIGLPYEISIKGGNLEGIGNIARNYGALAIPCHWWGSFGIGKQKLLENAEKFHAFEEFNGNCSPLNPEEIKEIREQTNLFGIATSDSHNRKDLVNGYIEVFEDLDFSERWKLSESLEATLKSGEFVSHAVKLNPLTSILGHIAIANYDVFFRRKLGLLK